MRLIAAHLICVSLESPAKRLCVDDAIPASLNLFNTLFLDKVFIHIANTKAELVVRLGKCGFSRECLPSVVGGSPKLSPLRTDLAKTAARVERLGSIYNQQHLASVRR